MIHLSKDEDVISIDLEDDGTFTVTTRSTSGQLRVHTGNDTDRAVQASESDFDTKDHYTYIDRDEDD